MLDACSVFGVAVSFAKDTGGGIGLAIGIPLGLGLGFLSGYLHWKVGDRIVRHAVSNWTLRLLYIAAAFWTVLAPVLSAFFTQFVIRSLVS